MVPPLACLGGRVYTRTSSRGGDKSLGTAVEKIDDFTVKIRQSAKNTLMLPVMTVYAFDPLDSAVLKQHATAADPWSHVYANTVDFPGFGAYCLDRWVRDRRVRAACQPELLSWQAGN